MKVSFSPDVIIPSGWLGSEHQKLTARREPHNSCAPHWLHINVIHVAETVWVSVLSRPQTATAVSQPQPPPPPPLPPPRMLRLLGSELLLMAKEGAIRSLRPGSQRELSMKSHAHKNCTSLFYYAATNGGDEHNAVDFCLTSLHLL